MVFSIPQIYCVSLLQRYNTPTYPANYGEEAIAIRAAESRHLRPARPADTSLRPLLPRARLAASPCQAAPPRPDSPNQRHHALSKNGLHIPIYCDSLPRPGPGGLGFNASDGRAAAGGQAPGGSDPA